MGNWELGEHSRKTRSSDNEGNRSFKKARYVWQLKGKYHLKESSQQSVVDIDKRREKSPSSNESDSDTENINANNNNGLTNNNNIACNERCCLDDLLSKSNALLDNDDSDQEITSNNIERSISDEIPITLVKPNSKTYDEYLQKWQARQVAKSFVDNTINSILEHWKIPFDAADFVENCETDEQVEDEGILMAIQSHGLQSGLRYNAPTSNNTTENEGEASRATTNLPLKTEKINVENVQNESIKNYPQKEAVNDNIEMEDPMDFLNAAVSVAIQGKGLSSFNFG